MKPAKVAEALRQIASKIDASKNPSSKLVAQDLNKLRQTLASYYPEIEHEITSGNDGPVTPFVVLSRAMDMVASKNATATDAANCISEMAMFSKINWSSTEYESDEFPESSD